MTFPPLLLAAAIGAGVALASGHAQVLIVGWTGNHALRVVRWPEPPWLLLAAAIAVIVGLAGWWLRRRDRFTPMVDSALRSLPWLNLLALPFLPVVADWFPALVALAGPLGAVFTTAVLFAVLWPFARGPLAATARIVARRDGLAFALAFVLFATSGWWVTRVLGPGGDEPHYLIITESLLRDGDLQIENNHRNRDYDSFFTGDLPPDYLWRGRDEVIYSVHAPGLPALLLPAYWAGGLAGANLFMGVLAALCGVAILRLSRALSSDTAGVIAWAGIVCSTPFFMHGWLIFPEMAAACCVAWSLWWIWHERNPGWRLCFVHGAMLGSLPWLHTKFTLLLAILAVAQVVHLLKRPVGFAAFAMPIATSIALWLWSFYVMYGAADPAMPYRGMQELARDLVWANVPRGLLGLAFDQEFGLLLYSPVLAMALAGAIPLLRARSTWRVTLPCLVGALFIVNTTRYYMWWGGWSVPARFVVPTLPMLAPWLAVGIERAMQRPAGRAILGALFTCSVTASALMIVDPNQVLLFNERTGVSKLVQWLQGPGAITTSLPVLWLEQWRTQLPLIASMTGALAAAVVLIVMLARRPRLSGVNESTWAVGFVFSLILLFSVGARLSTSKAAATDMIRSGQLALLDRWDGRRWFDATQMRWLSGADLLSRTVVPLYDASTAMREVPEDPRLALGPWPVPPGRYEIRVWTNPRRLEEGDLVATIDRSSSIVARTAVASGVLTTMRADVPAIANLSPIWVGASEPGLAAAIVRVELRPLRVTPSIQATANPDVTALENIDGLPGDFIWYLDRNAFAENGVFWTLGEATTHIVLAPAHGGRLTLDVETGAAGGTASIDALGRTTQLDMHRQHRETLDLGSSREARTVPVRVTFTGGVRPIEHGQTGDDRWLGHRVTPHLTHRVVASN
ncbi:MAG: hypothetical protein AB7I50_08450 [Vicinamibacterales bacterium]